MRSNREVFISVDIEASGPIPGEYSLLAIGACVVGQADLNFYAEIKPINDHYVASAIKITGLSMEKLTITGEEPRLAMERFEQWIRQVVGDNRPVLVAFNATFDWSFTHWYFIKYLGRDPFGISGLDIKAYYMGKHRTTWGETSKKKIRTRYQPQTAHTHQALEDAQEQAEIFGQMLAETGLN